MFRWCSNRLLHALALAWAVAFFVVVVPGHRGAMIPLGHDGAAAGEGGAYCPMCTVTGGAERADDHGSPSAPPVDAPVNCLLCFLKATVDSPPPVVLPPVFFYEIDFCLYTPRVIEAVSCTSQRSISVRGPPVIA